MAVLGLHGVPTPPPERVRWLREAESDGVNLSAGLMAPPQTLPFQGRGQAVPDR